jgi:hypothetical protein
MDVPDHASPAVIRDEDRVLLLSGRDTSGRSSRDTWIYEQGRFCRGPLLPHGLAWPRAWLGEDRVFVAGDADYKDYKLLELTRSLELVREHAFAWPPLEKLHVDRRGRCWALLPEQTEPLGEPLAQATILRCPFDFPVVCEASDGTLLAWTVGGPDHPQPRGNVLWRLQQSELGWEQLAVIPAGMTALWLELGSGRILLLTVHGDLVQVDPRSGEGEIVASLDEDKSEAFWAGGSLMDLGEGQILAIRPGEARRVDLGTGEVEPLAPPERPRVRGEGVRDPSGQIWLVGGHGLRKEGLPPERFPLLPRQGAKKRRPSGLSVLFPEGPLLLPEVGAQVRLKSGHFVNLVGTVLRRESEELLVEISLFGRALPIRIRASETESP